jgi:hypothetical protein
MLSLLIDVQRKTLWRSHRTIREPILSDAWSFLDYHLPLRSHDQFSASPERYWKSAHFHSTQKVSLLRCLIDMDFVRRITQKLMTIQLMPPTLQTTHSSLLILLISNSSNCETVVPHNLGGRWATELLIRQPKAYEIAHGEKWSRPSFDAKQCRSIEKNRTSESDELEMRGACVRVFSRAFHDLENECSARLPLVPLILLVILVLQVVILLLILLVLLQLLMLLMLVCCIEAKNT